MGITTFCVKLADERRESEALWHKWKTETQMSLPKQREYQLWWLDSKVSNHLPARRRCGCQHWSMLPGNGHQGQMTLLWLDPYDHGCSAQRGRKRVRHCNSNFLQDQNSTTPWWKLVWNASLELCWQRFWEWIIGWRVFFHIIVSGFRPNTVKTPKDKE